MKELFQTELIPDSGAPDEHEGGEVQRMVGRIEHVGVGKCTLSW